MLWPKKRCPYCQSARVQKRGFYGNGRQRWFCKECQRSYRWKNQDGKHNNERVWFERWMVEGYSVRQLVQQSGHSRDKLYRIINHWLVPPPSDEKHSLMEVKHVIFDGTFLHRPVSIVALMDGRTNTVIAGKHDVRENSDSQLATFFAPLKKRGLSPVSCTADGNPQAMRTIRSLWQDITIQRCLVHIQRQGLKWCRTYPKRTDAKHLRELFRDVTTIYTQRDRDLFLARFADWEARYGQAIVKTPERGRVFSDIKRARSMLIKALPDMFHYIDNPAIPKSTNGLEGYFSRLKGHYRHHRGLKPEKRANYFAWYFKLKLK